MSWKGSEGHSSAQTYDFFSLAPTKEHGNYKRGPSQEDTRRLRYDDDDSPTERFGSKSPSCGDLREFLETRKPKSWKRSVGRSVSPTGSRQRYESDDEDPTKELHKQLAELKQKHADYENDLEAHPKYQEELHKQLAELKQKHADYENDLEAHPKYQEEWRKFWNSRCEELHHFGIDTETYDFKPEWMEFWKLRLKELYEEDSEPLIQALRDMQGNNGERYSEEKQPPAKKKRSPSPEPPKRSRTPILSNSMRISPDLDDSLTIVSALDTITNLEEGLSRIGPKVIDLVGKSMGLIEGMDFDNFDRSKDLLNIKERLNGQLLHNKIQSVLKTFENITTILRGMTSTPDKGKKEEKEDPKVADDMKQWMSIFTDVIDNIEEKHVPPPATDHLTDAEVEALLQNFDTLSEKEKNHLIMFLKNLEKTDESRVKRLRYHFNSQVNKALSSIPDSTADHRWKSSRERSRSPKRSPPRYSRERDSMRRSPSRRSSPLRRSPSRRSSPPRRSPPRRSPPRRSPPRRTPPRYSRDQPMRRSRSPRRERYDPRSYTRSPDWSRESRSRSREWSTEHEKRQEKPYDKPYEKPYDKPQQKQQEKPKSPSPTKRPRTPSPLPEIFHNLQLLYQEQFKDPFYSDVIEAVKQPHWRAPPEVDTFIKFWKGLKIDPDSGTLKVNVSGLDVFVIPDRIHRKVIEDFHRRRIRSGQLMCRTRTETIDAVRKYCFIPNYVKIVNQVIERCNFCNQKKPRKPIVDQSGELFL